MKIGVIGLRIIAVIAMQTYAALADAQVSGVSATSRPPQSVSKISLGDEPSVAVEKNTGLTYVSPDLYARIPPAPAIYSGVLPVRAEIEGQPAVGSQGKQSSCTAFAVGWTVKSIQENTRRKWGLETADHIFSPAFIYNQLRPDDSCTGGTTFVSALNLVTRMGISPVSQFGYSENDCSVQPSQDIQKVALRYRISQWRRVNTVSEVEVKIHIAAGEPVMIGMDVDEAFDQLKAGDIYRGRKGKNLGPHAMVVDAYDDEKGGFRLVNSWGPKWGENGKAWIGYDAFASFVREGYVIPTEQDFAFAEAADNGQSNYLVETTYFSSLKSNSKIVSQLSERNARNSTYGINLQASPYTVLENAQLICLKGSCEDLEGKWAIDAGRNGSQIRAISEPSRQKSEWILSAVEIPVKDLGTIVEGVDRSNGFTVISARDGVSPMVKVSDGRGNQVEFSGGIDPRAVVKLDRTEVRDNMVLYHYQFQ